MLHLLLALLGVTVPGGLATYLIGPAKVLGFAKGLPSWVWIALAAIALLFAGAIWHQHKAKAAIASAVKDAVAEAITTRDGQWQARIEQERTAAIAWKGKFDAVVKAKIQLQRKLTDEENRRIAADAADLRVRGPGAAAAPAGCRPDDHSGLAGFAGRPVAQPGHAQAAGTEVSAENGPGQFAIVPWDWLVAVVSERDAFRVEALGWRGRDAMLAGIWQRAQAAQQPAPLNPPKGTPDGR